MPDEPLVPLNPTSGGSSNDDVHRIATTEVPGDVISGVREAFLHLEAAISTVDAKRAQGWVGPDVAALVARRVAELQTTGHRRVHGYFEIVGSDHSRYDGANAEVVIHALSSIHEMDAGGRVIGGSLDLLRWNQHVDAELHDGRWIITHVGAMEIVGKASGPEGDPMDGTRAAQHERDLVEQARREESMGRAVVAAGLFGTISVR